MSEETYSGRVFGFVWCHSSAIKNWKYKLAPCREVLKPEVWLIYSLANLLWRAGFIRVGFWCGSLFVSFWILRTCWIQFSYSCWCNVAGLEKLLKKPHWNINLCEWNLRRWVTTVVRIVNTIILLLLPNINAWQISEENNVLQDIIHDI